MPDSDEHSEKVLEDDLLEVILGLLRRAWCLFLHLVALLSLRRGCLLGDRLRLLSSELVDLDRLGLFLAPAELPWVTRCCLRALWHLDVVWCRVELGEREKII